MTNLGLREEVGFESFYLKVWLTDEWGRPLKITNSSDSDSDSVEHTWILKSIQSWAYEFNN